MITLANLACLIWVKENSFAVDIYIAVRIISLYYLYRLSEPVERYLYDCILWC